MRGAPARAAHLSVYDNITKVIIIIIIILYYIIIDNDKREKKEIRIIKYLLKSSFIGIHEE